MLMLDILYNVFKTCAITNDRMGDVKKRKIGRAWGELYVTGRLDSAAHYDFFSSELFVEGL